MWNNPDELVVASSGAIYVAPVGTALPLTPTAALASAFVGLGLVTEEGVSLNVSPEITDFMAWQSRQAVRREMTAQEIQASFQLEQWNEETVPLAFGGGEVTEPSTGVYRYDFPQDGDALDERAMVIDWQDGTENHRLVLRRGNVTEGVESTFRRSELALLPITFKALEPTDGSGAAYYLTDSDAFAAGS